MITETAPPEVGSSGGRRHPRLDDNGVRNLGLVGVLVVLVVIGIITKPDLYSDPTWVRNNVLTILQQALAEAHGLDYAPLEDVLPLSPV